MTHCVQINGFLPTLVDVDWKSFLTVEVYQLINYRPIYCYG